MHYWAAATRCHSVVRQSILHSVADTTEASRREDLVAEEEELDSIVVVEEAHCCIGWGHDHLLPSPFHGTVVDPSGDGGER